MTIGDKISARKHLYDTEDGAVLGIDVGWSETKPTTGLCLLEWTAQEISWKCCMSRADEREKKLNELVGKKGLLAVGLDGPLVPSLKCVKEYRAAEALLSRGKFQQRGKPGPTNSPFGYKLHEEATKLAKLVLSTQDLTAASYPHKVHDKAVMETFPNAFLAVLYPNRDFPQPRKRRRWTDTLFCPDKLEQLLLALLPGRKLSGCVLDIWGHEDVASFVCSLTALCAVTGRCVVIGSPASGYIVLPPMEIWGMADSPDGKWAADALRIIT